MKISQVCPKCMNGRVKKTWHNSACNFYKCDNCTQESSDFDLWGLEFKLDKIFEIEEFIDEEILRR